MRCIKTTRMFGAIACLGTVLVGRGAYADGGLDDGGDAAIADGGDQDGAALSGIQPTTTPDNVGCSVAKGYGGSPTPLGLPILIGVALWIARSKRRTP